MGQEMRRRGKPSLYTSILLAAVGALAGCAALPNSGPSASDVATLQAGSGQVPRYMIVDVNGRALEALKRRGFASFATTFGDRKIAAEPVIGVGDSVIVTVWEASAGGLFSPSQASAVASNMASAGANSATIPEQVVGRDGRITIPFAGRIAVAGKTTRAVQHAIEQALDGKSIQPQVLVNVTKFVSNSVSVDGEVTASARVPLSVKGDRVLDVIAEAGGIKYPVNETFVELTRGSNTSRVPLITIINNPRENIYLHPNDDLTLVRDPQTFIAYGATGKNAEIPFQADGITLAQALAKAGGLLDNRSDPRGVFVFRYEKEPVARRLNPSSPLVYSGRLTPVVYRLNLADPNSLFMEQSFRMANRDLLYVSNSPSTDLQKVFGIFSGGIGTLSSAAYIASTTPH